MHQNIQQLNTHKLLASLPGRGGTSLVVGNPEENTHLINSHQPLSALMGKASHSQNSSPQTHGYAVCARTPPAQAKNEDLYSDSKENKLLHLCMTNERKRSCYVKLEIHIFKSQTCNSKKREEEECFG